MKGLENLNGIIFGSTGVLGSNIAIELARLNTNLILHGKSIEKLKDLDNEIRKIKKKSILMQADVTDQDFYKNLLKTVSSRFKKIDFLINFIGKFNGLSPLTNMSHNEWNRMIEINLTSYWRIIKELEPLIRKSGNSKIIFLTNKEISEGKAYHNIFSISKGALLSMFKTFKAENRRLGIEIHLIDIDKINLGMTSKIRGNNTFDPSILKKTSKKILEQCFNY
ncbi:MAG: SDR family oxidoreductase [Pseudomonadota bacterium]|nr:SDR family oxidoreductase [Pseudomonadota bacterium]